MKQPAEAEEQKLYDVSDEMQGEGMAMRGEWVVMIDTV